MSTESIPNFESLLSPLSDEAPSGESLREHPELSRTFYALREARNSAMEAERTLSRMAMMEEEDFENDPSGRDGAKQLPDWNKVSSMAVDLLSNHSKDLWVVSWFIEALTRTDGLMGFSDGLKLCRQMSDKFWNTIHPRPDEDDGYAHTVAQLSGLDNVLSTALEATRILPEDDRFTWGGYQIAIELEQAPPEERSAKIERGTIPLETFESAMRSADRQVLLDTQEVLAEAVDECKQFAETMDRLCGNDDSGYPLGPSTGNLERTLERLQKIFETLTSGLLVDSPEGEAEAVIGELAEAGEQPPTQSTASLLQRPVASRDEALQHLLRVADFFRKSEPHSPVSYALEQAVRWGRMPLPDLLQDLVSDSDVLAQVFKRMGIAPTPDESSDD
ncbi:type VI secretion system protein TssA [Aureliella helgolandensis]|uniref:ImpA N-terminal domain-containing protein n=1 Tax=Aureliella helgolandensis TaxID=2527968 RepID=A0A518GAE3_9BACT|nr:type VI secretion system protein TssA [Aureliella helgolandensis]QDV25566.1 hypothetical protein Q31a_38920 [Aureliella helgolandensis]